MCHHQTRAYLLICIYARQHPIPNELVHKCSVHSSFSYFNCVFAVFNELIFSQIEGLGGSSSGKDLRYFCAHVVQCYRSNYKAVSCSHVLKAIDILKSDNFKKLIGFIVRTLGSQSNN